MRLLEGVLVTSRVDKHGEIIERDNLYTLAEDYNTHYLPLTVEHDPRTPPIGRFTSARIEVLEDGELALVGTSEVFEAGDQIEFKDDGREMPVEEFTDGRLHISYDRSYESPSDQELLEEMCNWVDGELGEEIKKGIEPLSILILAASFVGLRFATGFLQKWGADTWDLVKRNLSRLFQRKREEAREYLLVFRFTVRDGSHVLCLETFLSNPTENDVSLFLQEGLEELERLTPEFLASHPYLRKIVCEYANRKLTVKYGMRKDAVPLLPEKRS
jgi:hypothetical protein